MKPIELTALIFNQILFFENIQYEEDFTILV